MTFWAYMLRCADGKYYVGHSDNLEMRVAQHQAGSISGFTQTRRPVTLIWSETFADRDQAFAVEMQIKGWSRAKKEALIRGDWESIQALSRRGHKPAPAHAEEPLSPSKRPLEARPPEAKVLRDGISTSSMPPQDERGEDRNTRPPPAIILVRPQLGENIGKAARAMLNFGLTDLRLVAPRDGWPNPAAGPAASGADEVLRQARVFDTLAEATADCAHVYATTVRKRGVIKPVVTPEVAARAIHTGPGGSAILFGPERSGLESDDVAVARTIITVPINPAFGSLNLAQAVILVAYEWSKGVALASPPATERHPPAPQEEVDRLVAHLDAILARTGYYYPPDREHVDRRALRTILTSPGWNAGEVRTLRGVLRSIERMLPKDETE